MTWDDDGTALAVLKGDKNKKFLQRENQLIAFTALNSKSPIRHELNPSENRDFPKDMVISEKRRLSWNTDATKVFFLQYYAVFRLLFAVVVPPALLLGFRHFLLSDSYPIAHR